MSYLHDGAHPAPWWWRLATWLWPVRGEDTDRCRAIPEAEDPERGTVLRQVAIVRRHFYLQQFSQSEHPLWAHTHQWRWCLAIGLWGAYTEWRHGVVRRRRAPYVYWMGPDVVHRVADPTPGHTSLFLGLGRCDDLKHYVPVEYEPDMRGEPPKYRGIRMRYASRRWFEHVKQMVTRI